MKLLLLPARRAAPLAEETGAIGLLEGPWVGAATGLPGTDGLVSKMARGLYVPLPWSLLARTSNVCVVAGIRSLRMN